MLLSVEYIFQAENDAAVVHRDTSATTSRRRIMACTWASHSQLGREDWERSNYELSAGVCLQTTTATSHVNTLNTLWPSVPSGYGAADHGDGPTYEAAECAKNVWIQTCRHWKLNFKR